MRMPTSDDNNEDENLMTSSASGEDLFQTLASASTDGSYSSSSGDGILSSLPLFQEIGNLIHSYRSSGSLVSPSTNKNTKQPSIIEEEEEEEEDSTSSHRSLALQQQPVALTTVIPIETIPSAPLSEKTSDCIGLGYISSASTEDISPSTSSFTAAGERIITSVSSSLSDVSCPEGKFKDMEAKGILDGEAKFDTLVLHVASRNSEVISATTALFRSPRIAAKPEFHQSTQGALFMSPRNHISSTPNAGCSTTDSCLGESPSKGNVFTFDGFNMAEDEEATEDGIEEIRAAKSLSSDFSSTASGTMEHSEMGLLEPFQSLISRIIQLPNDKISPRKKNECNKSNFIQQSTVLPQHDFQKDVDNFTKRLREIKENVRCDVYLIEGDQSQASNSLLSMESNSQEEGEDDYEQRSNSFQNKQLVHPQSKAQKKRDEEVVYVFSVSEADQKESNNHVRSESSSLGGDKNTLLRTHCEKHVNPEILDHINKYGSFEVYKILPPPPPPPCTPPAMKHKHQQKYTNNRSHAPNSNGKDSSIKKKMKNNSRSLSPDEEETGLDSICDLSRYKLNALPSSDSTDAEYRHEKKSIDFDDPPSALKKAASATAKKKQNQTIPDYKDNQQNISPLILRERRDDNQASDTSLQSNRQKLRQSRIAALKTKNSRIGEEKLNDGNTGHENASKISNVSTTAIQDMVTNIEISKSDADASRRARILAMKKKSSLRGVEKISLCRVGENNEEKGVMLETSEESVNDRPLNTNFSRKARIRDLTKRSGLKQGEDKSPACEVGVQNHWVNEARQSSTGTMNVEKDGLKEMSTESSEHRSTRLARISALRAKSCATRTGDTNHLHTYKNEVEECANILHNELVEEHFQDSEAKSNVSLSRKARITELMGRKKLTAKGPGDLQSRVGLESVASTLNNDHDSAKHQQQIREETQVSPPLSTSNLTRKARILELKNKKKTVARLGGYSNEEKMVMSVDNISMSSAAQGETYEENPTLSLPNSLSNRRHARVLELKKKKAMSRIDSPDNCERR